MTATQQQPVPALPFVAGAHEHTEPAFTITVTPGATVQTPNPIDIPASGYFRYLFLEVVASGGAAGTIAADGPWNLFQFLNLQDVNGGNLFGPMDGFAAFIANLVGGYSPRNNPVDSPWFVGSAPNPSFYLRIPLEIRRQDGLGSIANQNSGANYRLAMGINTSANMFSVAPTTIPTFTIRGWLEAWTLPAATDNRQRPQSQVPPLLGTSQIISAATQSGIVAGANSVPLRRLGNYLRFLAFIARDNTGARNNAAFPDPWQFNWDGITIRNQSQRYSQQEFYEKTDGTVTLPAGVFVLPFNHGGPRALVGNEAPDLWLPSTQASRMSIDGSVATGGGTVQTVTCEVAPVEQDQSQRYVQTNADTRLTAPVATS